MCVYSCDLICKFHSNNWKSNHIQLHFIYKFYFLLESWFEWRILCSLWGEIVSVVKVGVIFVGELDLLSLLALKEALL